MHISMPGDSSPEETVLFYNLKKQPDISKEDEDIQKDSFLVYLIKWIKSFF